VSDSHFLVAKPPTHFAARSKDLQLPSALTVLTLQLHYSFCSYRLFTEASVEQFKY
jgi:hypothetical protein